MTLSLLNLSRCSPTNHGSIPVHQRPSFKRRYAAHRTRADKFLKQEGDIDRLFLLGDIFEAWIGDDDDSPLAQRFADSMKRIADSGTQIYFTRGNRDFLVGQNYLDQFGATLLGDSVCIEVAGDPPYSCTVTYSAPMTSIIWRSAPSRTTRVAGGNVKQVTR